MRGMVKNVGGPEAYRMTDALTIIKKLIRLIVKQLRVAPEKVTAEASFVHDLGVGSLDAIGLVMAIEEEFGIQIPLEDVEKMPRVRDAIAYIESRTKGSRP